MSYELDNQIPSSVRALGLLYGSVFLAATLVPIPVYFVVTVAIVDDIDWYVLSDSLMEGLSSEGKTPNPSKAPRNLIIAWDAFVNLDPYLADLYPWWAVSGVTIGSGIIAATFFTARADMGGSSGLRRKDVVTASTLFVAWSLVPFVIAFFFALRIVMR